DYFLVRRRLLLVDEAYRLEGTYRYTKGFNLAALVAIASGILVSRFVPAAVLPPVISLCVTAVVYLAGMRVLYPAQFQLRAAEPGRVRPHDYVSQQGGP